jgi:hypothetical protein
MNTTASIAVPEKGLLARIFGVVFSPRETYADVAARPRPFPILLFVLLSIAAANYLFLRTDIGQRAWADQALTQQEAYGGQITPQAVQGVERMKPYAAPISVAAILFVVPIVMALISGVVIVVFNAIMGGEGKFKQVFSIVAHSGVIGVLQNLFVLPLNYARESMSSATSIGVLLPFLDGNSFLGMFFGAIDLFQVWSLLSLSIGLGVLYKRRTAPIAWGFFALGLVIVLILTGIKAARSGA